MIASLGMYDMPFVSADNDAIWASVAARVDGAPARLDRSRPLRDIWRASDLLLAQTCGWPLVTELAGVVQLVATPIYEFPGCDGPRYRSWIVVGAGSPATTVAELRGGRAAINGLDSNSGMNFLRAAVAPLTGQSPFFGSVTVTGGHLASLAAVAAGDADAAAIDCVTYGLVARHRPDLLAGTRILASTPGSAGLPLVTAAATSPAAVATLRTALRRMLADPATEAARAALGWIGLAELTEADYRPIMNMGSGPLA